MIKIHDILQCPACSGQVDQALKCLSCGDEYTQKAGIPVMVSPKVTTCHSCWDSVDFETGRIMSKIDIYKRFLNPETIEAQAQWKASMVDRMRNVAGLAADVATGLGGLAHEMLESNPDVIPVSSDLDPLVLAWKQGRLAVPPGRESFSVASDALHFAFRDETFGVIANADGLLNICDTGRFLTEMRRTLKPGGKLLIMHRLFKPESRSFKLAKVYGIHRTLEAGPLMEIFEAAGFSGARIDEISRAVWADNPGQNFPVAGDLQHFILIEARK